MLPHDFKNAENKMSFMVFKTKVISNSKKLQTK